MLEGERQVAPTIDGIRKDHVARYRWAAARLPTDSVVIDVACGVGYGAYILACAGHRVYAVDRDAEAIAYAREHYSHPRITYYCRDASHIGSLNINADAAVCFETIEHLSDPAPFLRDLRANQLWVSAPDEDGFPYRGYKFHYRHYTRLQLMGLLTESGWVAHRTAYQQIDDQSDVSPYNLPGRTLIMTAHRRPAVGRLFARDAGITRPTIVSKSPEHVVILGLGPSLDSYTDMVKRMGGRRAFCDEVWGINAVGGVMQCDRVFHMDDVKLQERRAAARPNSNIAQMVKWLKGHPGPIYTSRVYDDYPGLVEFPLQDVINSCGFSYFNSTAAYAVAYAVHIGVKQIGLFGFDFTYHDSHKAERGRACVEFHLGIAHSRGVKIGFCEKTSLMDACSPDGERFYGYDAVNVNMTGGEGDPVLINFTPKELPTADEIEDRYCHDKHPNPLVRPIVT